MKELTNFNYDYQYFTFSTNKIERIRNEKYYLDCLN